MKQIKKLCSYFLFLTLLYNPSFSTHATFKQKHNPRSDNLPVAIVGDHKIFLDDFAERYSNYILATGIKDNIISRKAILDNIINEILLLNYDDNSAITSNQNYINEIAWTKKQTILAYLKDQEIYAEIKVTVAELRETFKNSNEKLAARHLYASTEEEANHLYQLLQMDVDFDFLAKHIFTDSVLRNHGGYLGYFSWGDMDPAFEDAAYSLKIGEVSNPVKTAHGYSIIKLEDRVSHPLLTESEFLQKKSQLERVLKIKKKNLAEKEYLRKIFDPKKVVFDEECLNYLFKDITSDIRDNIEKKKTENHTSKCVSYDGLSYTGKEILNKITELPEYHKVKINSIDKLKVVIHGFLIQDRLLRIVKEKGYDQLAIVKQTLSNQQDIIFLKFKRKEITDKAAFSDSLAYSYYEENKQRFSMEDEINVQEIIVESEKLADNLRNLLDNGKDFGELAEKYSLRKWSAANKGVMGFAALSKFGMLKEKFWNSPNHELLGPIRIENHYGLFKVLEKKQGKKIEYGLVKEKVIQALKIAEQSRIVKEYLDKLREQVNVEINEHILSTYDVANYVTSEY
ncbi:MAG: peptidylprolyl isomerase [Bacteroidota bacterium]|nr:peptidylprolyl isomerase [Bacteroidota bacterium]